MIIYFTLQIIDGDFHIFILEGLSEGGIRKLWDTLEHPEPNGILSFIFILSLKSLYLHIVISKQLWGLS